MIRSDPPLAIKTTHHCERADHNSSFPDAQIPSMDFQNLQSRSSSPYFPPHRTQLHPRMHSFTSPHHNKPSSSSLQSQTKCLVLFASLFTLTFLFYLISTAHRIHSSSKFSAPNSKFYAVVISSGDSGSRVRVFEFLNEGQMPFVAFDGTGASSMVVRPGLAGFAADPKGAGRSVAELLQFAKLRVPKKEWKNTKVQMLAGGELEGLERRVWEKILESCRKVLRASKFVFKDDWARLIKGEEQGIYAWVAVNYVLGSLGGEPQDTTGIVELGGTSLQVTFAPKEATQVHSSRIISLAGVTYHLYAQSLSEYGQDAAWNFMHELHNSNESTSFSSSSKGLISNPCIPRGYEPAQNSSHANLLMSHPAGNFSACRSEVLATLKRIEDKCTEPPCGVVSSLFPDLKGQPVSTHNLFFTSEFFGLVPRTSLFELEAAGHHYCEDDWSKLKNQHPGIDDMDLLRYCFSSAYTVALLHEGLGIAVDNRRSGLAKHSGSIPVDWTLGAFILETMSDHLELESDNLGQIAGNDSFTYLMFAFLLIAVLAVFLVLQWRKPQIKTIYDLEKGRYITTRVPR